MALQVWLPLNGNLNNNGTLNVTATNNGATVSASGKIGKCYSFDGSNDYISTYYTSKSTNATFSVWVKFNSLSSGVFVLDGRATNNSTGYQAVYVTSSTIQVGSGSSYVNFSYTFAINTWYHIVITYNSSIGCCYINGTLIGSSASLAGQNFNATLPLRIGSKYTSANYLNGLVNDVRVYDECLSEIEIKELAKGLIVHYPFYGNCGVGTNLAYGEYQCTSTSSSFNQSGSVVSLLTADEILKHQGDTLIFSYDVYSLGTYTSDSSSSSYKYSRFGIHASFNYTKTGASSGTQLYPFASTLARGKSGRVSSTWVIPTDISTINSNLSLNNIQTDHTCAYPDSENTSTWYLKNVKLEWGTTATPYTPSYYDMGETGLIEYDVSGNGYNGTYNTTAISTVSGAPRYDAGIRLTGSTITTATSVKTGAQYLTAGIPITATDKLTIAFWNKIDTYGAGGIFNTTAATSSYEDATDYNTTTVCNWDTTFRMYFLSGSAFNVNNFINADSTWHHKVFTYDGTTAKAYLDGTLISSSTINSTLPAFNGVVFGLGHAGSFYRQINESVSDFRIYATALSADDVKTLYERPISITSSGGFMTQGEVVEE